MGASDVIRTVLDDVTVARLRSAAEARHLDVENLIVQLLVSAAARVDELLGDPDRPSHA